MAERRPTKHVAVLAFPFGNHAPPLLNLVRKLSEAAPNLLFSFLSTAKSNSSVFSKSIDEEDSNIKPYNVNDGLPEGYVFGGNHVERMDLFLKEASTSFKNGMEKAVLDSGMEIECLISDALFWFAADIGRDMNVLWLPVWTSGPRLLFLHLQTDLILHNIKGSGSEDPSQSLDFLPGFSAIHVSDLPIEVLNMNLDSPFSVLFHKMEQYLPLATTVIINSYEEIDPELQHLLNSKFQKFLNVGPLTVLVPTTSFSDEHGCLQWLDEQGTKSVVYISFGGFVSLPPHELAELTEALEESGHPYLWSFRGNAEEILPKGCLEKANSKRKIVPWAPQLQVLKHSAVGAFVTHGGWNSVLESIAGGVPMIGRPFIGDQVMNVRTVEKVWGIGVGLEGNVITKNGVLKALELVLGSGEKGKEIKEKIGILRSLTYKAVESTGSSSRNLKTLVEIITK